jgi:transposase-like protein
VDGLKRIHDEKFSLVSQERKGKFKNIVSGESTTQDGKKKREMRKFKRFACHNFGDYARQCSHRKKGGNKTQSKVVVLAKAQVDGFFKKF